MAYEEIRMKNEVGRCLLCHNAPCTKACEESGDIAGILRSVRFENLTGAYRKLQNSNIDENMAAVSMNQCNLGKIGRAVDIPQIVSDLENCEIHVPQHKTDLSVDFCGIHCENPFFLSSSVVGSNYEMVAKAFGLGWAGVAFKTIGLFVPDEVSPRFTAMDKENTPFVGFKNIEQISDHTLEENLMFLQQLKRNYPTKIIIASIMGQNEEEWTILAKKVEEAGADLIECNFSCPQMVGKGLGSDVGTNPDLVRRYTAATRRGTSLPILAKMTPNITRMEDTAKAAVEAGADAIAAINTIKSIMNVSLPNFETEPNIAGKSAIGGYSGKAVKPIALRYICDIRKCEEIKDIPISGMGGIETWRDAAEFIAMGCETVQVTTAVMQYGYRIIEDMLEGLSDYMTLMGVDSIADMTGQALSHVVKTDELDRSTIEYPKFYHKKCISCGRCYVSCYDGGHQAISMGGETGFPILDPKACVGCQLCRLVCPAQAIDTGVRTKKK